MKQISTIFTAVIVLLLTACNNQPKPVEEKPVTVTKPAETKASLTPYKGMVIQHTVKDYDKWFAGYSAHDSVRKAFGIHDGSVARGLDNDKMVYIFSMVSDVQKAKDFGASPDLKDAMKKAGVTGTPTISYQDVLRDDTSTIPQMERIMVVHHVKDFDAWLKVYDAEGMAARAANGLVDRLLARGIDDPNTVTLLFAITDMAKAKARVASPEMKKLMTDAGVDAAPQINYFKWVSMN